MWYKIQKIYVGTNQVRPHEEKPIPDTYILYMPMTTSAWATDKSKNWYTITNTDVTFWTYQWVDCWYFNGSSAKMTVGTKFTLPANATFLCWCYCYSKSTYYDRKIFDFRWSYFFIPYYYCWGTSGSGQWYGIYTASDGYLSADRTWSWYLYYALRNWSSISYWVKWSSSASGTKTIWSSAAITATSTITIGNDYSWAARYWYGWLSELILDWKLWTSAEVDTYYNSTKSKYWL